MIRGKFAVPPTLSDALEFHRADAAAQLRVAIPGEIMTYDAATRTAEIKVCYNRVYNDGSVHVIKHPLVDVPMFTLQGGGVHIGLPIKAGDECWVFFADINIDAWHAKGGAQTPMSQRRHDIADGFAFVGPNSLANPIVTALGATEGGLATATTKVAIDKATGKVNVSNGPLPANSLAGILDTLLTALGAATTVPQVAAAATAAKASLATVLY